MGTRRSDPVDKRRQTLMRQAASQTEKYGIGGALKSGQRAPRQPSLPKMPWDEVLEDEHGSDQ